MTSEIVINEGAARRITERICILLDSVAGQMDRLAHAVQVTGKGQIYFINKFLNQSQFEEME